MAASGHSSDNAAIGISGPRPYRRHWITRWGLPQEPKRGYRPGRRPVFGRANAPHLVDGPGTLGSLRRRLHSSSRRGPSGGIAPYQFSDGFDTVSITSTVAGAFVASSFKPSCSWN